MMLLSPLGGLNGLLAVLKVILLVSLFCDVTLGFFPADWKESFSGKNGVAHEKQTNDVYDQLARKYFPSIKENTGPMIKARKAITKANMDVDDDQYHSSKHCDGENLQGGQQRVLLLFQDVIDQVKAGEIDKARESLGGALHTVQDFYAHSNWVELGNKGASPELGRPVEISNVAGLEVQTCKNCTTHNPIDTTRSNCPDCRQNEDDFLSAGLTSGYYNKEDRPLSGPIPSYKCHHGGYTDDTGNLYYEIGFGKPNPGINKDSLDCGWSPHHDFHRDAVAASMAATVQYIEDIKAQLSISELEKLFGVGPTLSFVIDTTGSMADIISGVEAQAAEIVTSRLGTSDEPLNYVLSPFNDPETGPVTITSDSGVFLSQLGSLTASGGGDCPELSMTGILNALNVTDDGATVFMFTDAASKDYFYESEVIEQATTKKINIVIFKFDSGCDDGDGGGGSKKLMARVDSASDRVYGAIALATGGQYHSLARSDVSTISGLISTLTTADSNFILKVADSLTRIAGTAIMSRNYSIPVDCLMTQFAVSLRGSGYTMIIAKPDGSILDATATNTTTSILQDGIFMTITSPVFGIWSVTVTGNGNYTLDITGVSSLHFSTFDVATLRGRPGHRGYYASGGQPAYDHDVGIIATLDGKFNSAAFDLRSPTSALLNSLSLNAGSGEFGYPSTNSFFGILRFTPGQFYVYSTGIDSCGNTFQRVLPNVITPYLSNTDYTGLENSTFPGVSRGNATAPSLSSTSSLASSSASAAGPHLPPATAIFSSSSLSSAASASTGSSGPVVASDYKDSETWSTSPAIPREIPVHHYSGEDIYTVTEIIYTTTSICPVTTASSVAFGTTSYMTFHSISTIIITEVSTIICSKCLGRALNSPVPDVSPTPALNSDVPQATSVCPNGYLCPPDVSTVETTLDSMTSCTEITVTSTEPCVGHGCGNGPPINASDLPTNPSPCLGLDCSVGGESSNTLTHTSTSTQHLTVTLSHSVSDTPSLLPNPVGGPSSLTSVSPTETPNVSTTASQNQSITVTVPGYTGPVITSGSKREPKVIGTTVGLGFIIAVIAGLIIL